MAFNKGYDKIINISIIHPEDLSRKYLCNFKYDPFDTTLEESFKLLSTVLSSLQDPELVKLNLGRKIIMEPVMKLERIIFTDDNLSEKEWEKLALYLRVTYMDEKQDVIIAEITEKPVGEVIYAVFDNSPAAFFTAKFC